jgi:hypothetical protein
MNNYHDSQVEAPGSPGRRRFVDSHAWVAREISLLAAQARSGQPGGLAQGCFRLARELAGHLAAEEEFLLPKFRQVNATEAACLVAEHDSIRNGLAKVQTEIDRGALRPETLERLLESLTAHAGHEKAMFYPWAQDRFLGWVWAMAARRLWEPR